MFPDETDPSFNRAIQLDQSSCLTNVQTDQAASLSLIMGAHRTVEAMKDTQLATYDRTQNINTAMAAFRADHDISRDILTKTHGTTESIKEISSSTREYVKTMSIHTDAHYAKSQLIEETITAMSSEIAIMKENLRSFQGATRIAIRSLQRELSRGSKSQAVLMSRIIESTMQDVLKTEASQSKQLAEHRNDRVPLESPTRPIRRPTSHQSSPVDATTVPLSTQSDIIDAFKSRQQTIHQTQRARTYHTWIGDVTVVSIYTEVWAPMVTHGGTKRLLTSSSTLFRIAVRPNGYFLKRGVSGEIHWTTPSFTPPSLSITNLRIWNVVSQYSPIIQACRKGDLENVYTLFSSRHASPFDRCEIMKDEGAWFDGNNASLLDIAFLGFDHSKFYESSQAFLKLIRLLVDCGLDPGEAHGKKGYHPVEWLILMETFYDADMQSILSQMVRIIVEESNTDPFNDIDNMGAGMLYSGGKAPRKSAPIQILIQQERWHLSWLDMPQEDAKVDNIYIAGALYGWCCYKNGNIDPLLSHLDSIGQRSDMAYIACSLLRLASALDHVKERSHALTALRNEVQYHLVRLLSRGLDPRASVDTELSDRSMNTLNLEKTETVTS